jgi:hypothetical protein
MSSMSGIPSLNRPAFFDGQQLTAADLDEVQRYHRELRWLHNRSLHGWGIAFGYSVTGIRGERSVHVNPGYALDCLGRDLILSEAVTMPIPAVAGASDGGPAVYYLTVSYAADKDLSPVNRAGRCNTSGAVRRPERPTIRWQNPNDTDPQSAYRHGLDVILGVIKVRHCQLDEPISLAERRNAAPSEQPHIAAGQTGGGSTLWNQWPNTNAPLGVSTIVSTSSAGFHVTPRYHAHVAGSRLIENEKLPFIVDGYAQIADPTPTSFSLHVFLPTGLTRTIDGAANIPLNPPDVFSDSFLGILQLSLQWHVVWMGIEE